MGNLAQTGLEFFVPRGFTHDQKPQEFNMKTNLNGACWLAFSILACAALLDREVDSTIGTLRSAICPLSK
jgi:hypothetical protein